MTNRHADSSVDSDAIDGILKLYDEGCFTRAEVRGAIALMLGSVERAEEILRKADSS